MHRIIKTGVVAALAFMASSCLHDSFNLDPCPERLEIIPQWVNTTPHPSGSANISIIPESGAVKDTVSTADGIIVDLPGGKYDIVGSEEAANVSVQGRVISVAAGTDGLLTDPGPLAGGAVSATVENFDEPITDVRIIPVPMRQQTRELIIEVVFLNAGFSSVTGLAGEMKRIAASRDINNGFPTLSGQTMPEAITYGSVAYTFSAVNEEGEDFFRGSRQLLGVDGRGLQVFDLTISASGDSRTFAIDLSRAMDGFHTNNVDKPWVIILDVDLSANLELTIINWTLGEISDIIAE